jgi:hypothetical protein
MKAKLIYSSNPKFEYIVNKEGELISCSEGRSPSFYYLNGINGINGTREKLFQTSVIMSMSLIGQEVTINTMNSVYTFEILGDLTCIEY